MDRGNHYEAAFEAYLRRHRLAYVAVDEARRSLCEDDSTLKSLDFIVHGPGGRRLLVDVKGRRYPGGPADRPRRVWENWSTADDLDGLGRWGERFGDGYEGVLAFAYCLGPKVNLRPGTPDVWEWHGRRYLLRGVSAGDYRGHMRVRSRKWGTVCLAAADFRRLVRPFADFALDPAAAR